MRELIIRPIVYLLCTPPRAVLSDPDARVEPQKLLDALRQATCRVFWGLSLIAMRPLCQGVLRAFFDSDETFVPGGWRTAFVASQSVTAWPKAARAARSLVKSVSLPKQKGLVYEPVGQP